jgi:hypothetical protein
VTFIIVLDRERFLIEPSYVFCLWWKHTRGADPSGMLKLNRKVKDKVVPVLNEVSTAPWRRTGECRYSSIILDVRTRRRRVVSFTHLTLYPRGKSPRYPLDRGLGGPQSRSGRRGVETNLLPGIRTPPVLCVAIPTELSRKTTQFHEEGIQRFRGPVGPLHQYIYMTNPFRTNLH